MTKQKPKAQNGRTWSRLNQRDIVATLKMIVPLMGLIAIGVYFHDFVVEAIKHGAIINGSIIAVTAYGIILILMRLLSAQADFLVIERFGYEAGKGVHMKTLLGQAWLKRRYVRHYLSHIANTGGTLSSQMDQAAIENELHALQAEYDSRLELPQFLVGFMIAMGLLGTFIGLLETLTGISGMLDGMGGSGADVEAQFMKLVVELRKPLAGMGIAFSASMFGLITSLLLAIMMTSLRRYISRVISLARNVMHELIEHASHTPAAAGAGTQLSPETIARLVSAPEPANTASNSLLIGRFDVMFKKMDMLIGSFESSIAGTKKLTDLLGFGPRMQEISERTLEELKTISTRYTEQTQYVQKMLTASSEAAQMAQAAVEQQKLARSELTAHIQTLSAQLAKLEAVDIGGTRHLFEIKESFTQVCKSLSMIDLIASGVSGQSVLLESLVEETRRAHDTLGGVRQDMRNKTP